MADSTLGPEALAEAEQGFAEFSQRFAELAGVEEDPLDGIIRFLRSIPAEDMAKKRELAAFFRTEEGGEYTDEEKKAAYDELLGEQRNGELRG